MIEFAGVLLLRRRRMSNLAGKQKSTKTEQIGCTRIMEENCGKERIKNNDIDSIVCENKDSNLIGRPPVGYALNGEPSRDHAINSYDINENETTTPVRNVFISTTKIDAIASIIYFLSFFLFNFICLILYLNTKEMSSTGTKNIQCACEHIDSGINPAWKYLSEDAKKICRE